MSETTSPVLLLLAPDEAHPFDAYLGEILLTEGYNCYEQQVVTNETELPGFALVIISAGGAAQLPQDLLEQYVIGGGRAIVMQPPRSWASLLGLGQPSELYSVARNAYLQVNAEHPWLQDFSAHDLQCLGDNHIYPAAGAEVLAYTAGQLGQPSIYPAVALHQVGDGAIVSFTYDLPHSLVLAHQGRPEYSSTGTHPDANADGKFTPDDNLEGLRDFSLRHVPQADVHQDLLLRVIRGLMADAMPLPRLWHFPGGAPGLLFIDGDGDSMVWEDLEWVLAAVEEHGVKYTLYLMTEQIEAFDPQKVAALRALGHDFGVHPWAGPRPDVPTWEDCVREIMDRFAGKFGYRPRAMRSHSCIFPGWDETPELFAQVGLNLDTNFAGGYRYVSGYLNGSALPVKFMSRRGQVIDCYEQSTVQTEDGSCTPKCLLPPMCEEEALALALQLMADCARRWHGVFHPYFHPISLAGRTHVHCQHWFKEVLRTAHELGLPSVNATEWLDFNEARRSVRIEDLKWDGGILSFALQAQQSIMGLSVMLPPVGERQPVQATSDDAPVELTEYPYEGLQWHGLTLDLQAGQSMHLMVHYE